MRARWLSGAILLLAATPAPAAPPPRLTAEIARLSRTTDGVVGVAAHRLDGGETLTLNADQPFPMASMVKVVTAGAVLAMVDAGRLSLDRLVAVTPDKVTASDGIADFLPFPGAMLSIRNLIELAITRSDNTAADLLMAEAGGPRAVQAWVDGLGVRGLRIDGDIKSQLYREGGYAETVPGNWAESRAAARRDFAVETRLDADRTAPGFDRDPRDTASPAALLALLDAIGRGRALSPASTTILIETMERCRTGAVRIKGLLPEGTVVAHKTGTLAGITNDFGFVTLPDGSKLAIVVMVRESIGEARVRNRAIAEIARTTYDWAVLAEAAVKTSGTAK